jgi:HEAT repeat protein
MGQDELTMLLQMLTTGGDESREVAALALGRFGRAAIESLTALQSLDSADVRWWVARALAEVGGDGAVRPLICALADPDPDVRACAALALGQLRAGTAAPAVAHCLADVSAFVASIAADALTMIGEPAVAVLAEALNHEQAHTRLLAVRALGRIHSQKAGTPLFGALEDRSYLVRYYAQEALDALGVGMVYLAP